MNFIQYGYMCYIYIYFICKRDARRLNETLIVNEKRRVCVHVASFARDDAKFDNVADRREHVTQGHVTRHLLAGADAGVDRVGPLLDDSVATCGATARRAR